MLEHKGRLVGLGVAMAVLVGLQGCASTSSGTQPNTTASEFAASRREALREAVKATGLQVSEVVFPDQVTDEMRAWLKEHTRHTSDPRTQLAGLLDSLLDERYLNVRYAAGYTGTAPEVFATRQANCLAFSHLFVSLAMELGIDVYYMDVDQVQRYEKDDDLVIISGHVTAGYGIPSDRLVLEFSVGPDADYRSARKVSDIRALSMYHSNRGAEVLREGKVGEAVEWLRTAITLDPTLPDAWINYGVALRRSGDEEAAEESYLKALEVDPHAVTAYSNLAALMRRRGRNLEADELLRVAEHLGDRNPYSFINLGDMHLLQGEVDEAERFYRKAMRLYGDLADPYAAMGLLAHTLDRPEEARRWLRRAQKRDPENARVRALEHQLEPALGDDKGIARLVPRKDGPT